MDSRFYGTIEGSTLGALVIDIRTWSIKNADFGALHILGYKDEELSDLKIHDVFRDISKKILESVLEEKFNTARVLKLRCRASLKDGLLKPLTITILPFNKHPYGVTFILESLEEIEFAENSLTHLNEIESIGFWQLDVKKGTIHVNKKALDITGFKNEKQFLPGNLEHFFKELQHYRSLFKKTLNEQLSFDEVFLTKEKVSRRIRCTAFALSEQGVTRKIIGSLQDVTKKEEDSEKIGLKQLILNEMEDMVFVLNSEGKLLFHNKALETILGFSSEELDKATVFDFDNELTKEKWSEHITEIHDKGRLQFEGLMDTAKGVKLITDFKANSFKFQGQEVNVAVCRDITEKKKDEERLKRAYQEINQLKDKLQSEANYLKDQIKIEYNFNEILGVDQKIKKVFKLIHQVSKTKSTVLVTGETGTGKELVARAIHNNSDRKDRVLIKINCATLPQNLIESELFGHEKGSFTGAEQTRLGKFEIADKGTLFLDEIGEMPLTLQAKLLRVLQEMEFERLGGNKTIKIDVRVIAATNRNLEEQVREGKFRADLFYRLCTFPIHLPPLRERKKDIVPLAFHFLKKMASKSNKSFEGISKITIQEMLAYNWPGNIRELENVIERQVILADTNTLQFSLLKNQSELVGIENKIETSFISKSLQQMERDYITLALNQCGGKIRGQGGAAQLLDVHPSTLDSRIKKLGIQKKFTASKE